jgi:hypothetical protein
MHNPLTFCAYQCVGVTRETNRSTPCTDFIITPLGLITDFSRAPDEHLILYGPSHEPSLWKKANHHPKTEWKETVSFPRIKFYPFHRLDSFPPTKRSWHSTLGGEGSKQTAIMNLVVSARLQTIPSSPKKLEPGPPSSARHNSTQGGPSWGL